jgi:hypothetical protein
LIFEITKNKKRPLLSFSDISFSLKTWLWITSGIFTMAVIFFAFLLTRTNIREIIANFPMLFTDYEYRFAATGVGEQNIFSITKSLFEIIKINPYLFAVFTVLMAVVLIDKKRTGRRPYYLIAVSLIFIAYVAVIIMPSGAGAYKFAVSENLLYCTLPLTMVGIICYILSVNKDKQIFAFLWVPGIIYAFCLDISSDLGTLSSIQAFAVLDTASVIFIKNIIDEIRNQNPLSNSNNPYKKSQDNNKIPSPRLISCSLVAVLFFQIGFEVYIDLNFKAYSVEYAYSHSTEKLSDTLQSGPLKGLKTTPSIVTIYSNIIIDLSEIKQKSDGPVLVVDDWEWPYLYLNMPYATYSSYTLDWFFASQNRLPEYYKLHPDKKPKYIYLSKYKPRSFQYQPEQTKMVLDDILEKYDCTFKESIAGYIVEINQGVNS